MVWHFHPLLSYSTHNLHLFTFFRNFSTSKETRLGLTKGSLSLWYCCCSVAKSCLTLCNPVNCSRPGFSVHHYLPEFAQTHVHWVSHAIAMSLIPNNAVCLCCVASVMSDSWDPLDYSPPGSSVHGTHQERILEWNAIPSSRGSSQPRDWTRVSYISCIGRGVLYHLGSRR